MSSCLNGKQPRIWFRTKFLRSLDLPDFALLEIKTFAWLERGVEQREPKMVILNVEPKWNNLHDDPRFITLMKRMNFPA